MNDASRSEGPSRRRQSAAMRSVRAIARAAAAAATATTSRRFATTSASATPGAHGRVPVVHHRAYSKPQLPKGHRFPMPVFDAIYRTCVRENVIDNAKYSNCFTPSRMPTMDELCAAHEEGYARAVCASALSAKQLREIGLPWSDDLVERTLAEVSGTMLTVELALRCGLAVNTAGGTHHANYDRGSGYCVLSDLCASAFAAISSGAVERVMIVDLDVHQGDGTAGIVNATGRRDEVYTFSAHASSNFPARKETSSRDVELAKGTGDDEYMAIVSAALRESMEDFKPQLVIYDAGVDVTENDSLGHLSMSVEGLYRRERMVLDTVLGAGIPLAGVVGGGYSPDIDELASRHCVLHRVAQEMFVDHGL